MLDFPNSLPDPLVESGSRAIARPSIRVQYGDGYIFSRAKGINASVTTIPLAFILKESQRTTLKQFLAAVGTHSPFTATFPGYPQQAYILEEGEQEEPMKGFLWRYSFTVRNYYGAAAPVGSYLELANSGGYVLLNPNTP